MNVTIYISSTPSARKKKKEKRKTKTFEYLENGKNFLDEIKSIFHNFLGTFCSSNMEK